MTRKLPPGLRGAAKPGAGRRKPVPITLPTIQLPKASPATEDDAFSSYTDDQENE